MPRLVATVALPAVLLVFLAALLPAAAEDAPAAAPQVKFADLDVRLQKDIASKARAYLDPTVEFLWRPRKELIATLDTARDKVGVEALADIPFLREVVYQGRHFLPLFSERSWLRENRIAFKKTSGVYRNLKSEAWRLTYSIPRSYPNTRTLAGNPRGTPLPLLAVIHEERDTVDARHQAVTYPGAEVLERLYPKGEYGALYDKWMLLAPVAARGKFVEEDGSIRHRYMTGVLTEFWRRYHVDFDRIVLDGGASAAALAAAFPHVLAGLVLRTGEDEIETNVVKNYAHVPVFVVKRPKLAAALREAGHPDVTEGTDKDAAVWIGRRKRTLPKNFEWSMVRDDHKYANWLILNTPDYEAPNRELSVEVVDTETDPNTIQIQAEGIESFAMFLNDQVVDLGRPVRLVVNGHETVYDELKRDFSQTFSKDPNVRKNMNFGWLFPVRIDDIKVLAPEEGSEDETAPSDETETDATLGSPEDEATAKKWWDMAEKYAADGLPSRAKTFYERAIKVGETSYKAKAEAKLAALPADGE